MNAEAAGALTGRTIGRYRILSLLGAGGMGQVYLAEDTGLRRRVALKLLSESPTHDEKKERRLRQAHGRAPIVNQHDLVARQRQLVSAAGADPVERGEEPDA